jgi:diaminobutyrate-2-oxoglutarate transaminase
MGPVRFLPFPQEYRCPFGVGGEEGVGLAIRAAERVLASPQVGPAASLIVEGVLGEGGSIPAAVSWLRALRSLSARVGTPMIADEVQAGMCRTGEMWSFEHADVVPDVVIVSKGLGGGVPIAAVVMRPELNIWEPGAFTGTFRGSVLGFAAATAVLRFARTENLAERVTKAGARLLSGLEEVAAGRPAVAEVRGLGLMLGVEIVDADAAADGRGTRPPAPGLARALQRACFDQGVLVEVGGVYENVVRFLPPLLLEDADVDEIVVAFEASLDHVGPGCFKEAT